MISNVRDSPADSGKPFEPVVAELPMRISAVLAGSALRRNERWATIGNMSLVVPEVAASENISSIFLASVLAVKEKNATGPVLVSSLTGAQSSTPVSNTFSLAWPENDSKTPVTGTPAVPNPATLTFMLSSRPMLKRNTTVNKAFPFRLLYGH